MRKFLKIVTLNCALVAISASPLLAAPTAVAKATIKATVSSAGTPVEEKDANNNVLSAVSKPVVAKITNKTILEEAKTAGVIPDVKGYSIVYVAGNGLYLYKKGDPMDTYTQFNKLKLVYTQGTKTLFDVYKEKFKFDGMTKVSQSGSRSGLKDATLEYNDFQLKSVVDYKASLKTSKVNNVVYHWISESMAGNFVGFDMNNVAIFDGNVKLASPKLMEF